MKRLKLIKKMISYKGKSPNFPGLRPGFQEVIYITSGNLQKSLKSMEIPKIFRPSAGFSEVLYRTFQKFYSRSTIEVLDFRPSAEKQSSIVEKKFYNYRTLP